VHVFFLPSHFILALWAGIGAVAIGQLAAWKPLRTAVTVACLCYVLWRGYDTFPAVDRSWDHRPEAVVADFITPPGRNPVFRHDAVFGVDANWQIQNVFEYYMRERKPGIPWFTLDMLEWTRYGGVTRRFQHFIDRNLDAGREVVIAPEMLRGLRDRGYSGAISNLREFEQPPAPTLATRVKELRDGTLYAFAYLKPYPEYPVDPHELKTIWLDLVGSENLPPFQDYNIIIGQAHRPPYVVRSDNQPYRLTSTIGSAAFDIRMESWLPTDTIRRAGFGHVIVNRRHVLSLDRGLSFVALDVRNGPALVAYAAGLFEPIPRLIPGLPADRR